MPQGEIADPAFISIFNSQSTAEYKNVHAYDQMITSADLATDEATLQNNYMKLIFGGLPDPLVNERDVQRAYQTLDTHIEQSHLLHDDLLNHMDPERFVPRGEEPSKEDILNTFAEMRKTHSQGYENEIDRGYNERLTPAQANVMYYGKNLNRYHRVLGQMEFLPDLVTANMRSADHALSSRTHAPFENNTQVPHNIQLTYDTNQRDIPGLGALGRPQIIQEPRPYNILDDGLYHDPVYSHVSARDFEDSDLVAQFTNYKL